MNLITVFGLLAIITLCVGIYFASKSSSSEGFNPNCNTILGCCNGYGPGWRNTVLPTGACGCVNANYTEYRSCFGN